MHSASTTRRSCFPNDQADPAYWVWPRLAGTDAYAADRLDQPADLLCLAPGVNPEHTPGFWLQRPSLIALFVLAGPTPIVQAAQCSSEAKHHGVASDVRCRRRLRRNPRRIADYVRCTPEPLRPMLTCSLDGQENAIDDASRSHAARGVADHC